MKNIKDSCIHFFYNEDTRKDIKEILTPLGNIVYNEIYAYLWVICFYSIFLFVLLLFSAVFFLSLFKNPLGCKGYILGLMLGFIPCGMLYGAFAIASAFSFPFFRHVLMKWWQQLELKSRPLCV